MLKYHSWKLGATCGLEFCLRMVFRSGSGPHKVLDNDNGTTVQMMFNSEFGKDKLRCSRREVVRYSGIMTTLKYARSEVPFLLAREQSGSTM